MISIQNANGRLRDITKTTNERGSERMTVKEVMSFPEIDPSSLIILASKEAFIKFIEHEYTADNNLPEIKEVNIAEFAAEEAKIGGRYYSLIKDLQVTDIVQFKDDCEEECYAIVVDITENQITTLKALIDDLEYEYRDTGTMITI